MFRISIANINNNGMAVTSFCFFYANVKLSVDFIYACVQQIKRSFHLVIVCAAVFLRMPKLFLRTHERQVINIFIFITGSRESCNNCINIWLLDIYI